MRFSSNEKAGLTIVILSFLLSLPIQAQVSPIRIKSASRPLNEVLIDLRDQYSIRVSFDHNLLSQYRISIDTVFSEADEAITFLVKDIPIKYKKSFQTFILYPTPATNQPKMFVLKGKVIDGETKETLPYSHIQCNNQLIISDQNGNFSVLSEAGSEFRIAVSYLGYYILDTIVMAGRDHFLKLYPSRYDLQNVIITGDNLRIARQVTNHPGEFRLNPQIATLLPGNGDHSLFNLLRLQPGILAAGEQSNDLIIWGCYEGQSQVMLDGFTLYGLKNFNDQISVVNPLLIKDIRVLKGGFESRYGNRVGGIVDITGFDGQSDKVHGDLILNNMTLNGLFSIPISKRSSLIIAGRNTWYNLYRSMDLSIPARTRIATGNPVDMVVQPDYTFKDVNLKYSGTNKRGDQYSLHMLYGTDSFSYHIEAPGDNYFIRDTLQERNKQQGISGNYNFRWKSGQITSLSASFSGSSTDMRNLLEIQRNSPAVVKREASSINRVSDLSLKFENRIMIKGFHTLEYGAGSNNFKVTLQESSTAGASAERQTNGWLGHAFIQDRISLSEKVIAQLGFRADFPSAARKLFIQPRFSIEWEIHAKFRVKASIGKYNQFLVKSASEDDAGNIKYFWGLADQVNIPVVESKHLTIGGYLDWQQFQFHAEAWYKTYDGITRYRAGNLIKEAEIAYGEGLGAGIDLYAIKQLGRHTGWIGYSLAKTIERFPGSQLYRYSRAPQDQTHELKVATLFDFNPVYFSASFVYGSGFPIKTQALLDPTLIDYPYSRVDASLTYRKKIKNTRFEGGISVLNILNTQNIKISNFVRIPINSLTAFNIQAEALPFTPSLFLKFSF